MTAKKFTLWIRLAVIGIAICGLFLCGVQYPFMAYLYGFTGPMSGFVWAWLSFLWAVSVPCFVILGFIWKISCYVKNDMVFTRQVAQKVKACALILYIDTAALLLGGMIFAFVQLLDIFVPVVFLLVLLGFSIATFTAILSHYCAKTAAIREENEGTV